MRCAASGHVDVAPPDAQHRNCQMGRCAEAEQPNALASLDSRDTQAAKAYDSGAEQRRGMQVVELPGQRGDEIGAGPCVLGIAAVDRITGGRRLVAEVLHSAAAVRTGSGRAADPRPTDTLAGG